MERLAAEDQLMLWPDEIWPQDVGALAILDGRNLLEPDGRLRIAIIRQAIAARLHLVPRLRQILRVPRRGLGPPLWVDAPHFDITEHVREAAAPRPADETALLQAVEQLRRRRLDRSRPLWEVWLLPGLPGDRVGMFVRLHHVVADGIAAVATLGTLLDTTPDVPVVPARTWRPAPAPRTSALVADNLRQHGRNLRRILATLVRPVTTARRVRAAWPAMRHTFAEVPTPTTSLNRVVGPNRAIALVRSDLDSIRRIAYAHDATINDVLLAVTAAGVRELLSSRGESVHRLTLPVYVPVTLRPADGRAQARGNAIAQMIIPLPVGTTDPDGRLRQITAQTAERKARPHPPLGRVLSSRIARRTLRKVLARHPVSVTTADLPGPPRPLYLAGARLLEVFPLLPLIDKVSLGVGAMSYAGQFTIAVIADADVCPDLDVFTAGAERELRTLTAAVSVNA